MNNVAGAKVFWTQAAMRYTLVPSLATGKYGDLQQAAGFGSI
jgi:hypothetical protein